MRTPTGNVHQAELQAAVAQAAAELDPREFRDVRFTLGSDSDGEPSIFFAILLTPYASHQSRLADVTILAGCNRWRLRKIF